MSTCASTQEEPLTLQGLCSSLPGLSITPAYTAETIQVLYFDFTKAIFLVSLPLDLITLLALALLGSFIPNKEIGSMRLCIKKA